MTLVEKSYANVGGKHRNDKTENLKIYYELHGHGPNKLFFIMGLNTSCQSWEHQVKYFGEHPDYQICIFDNRGVGFSDSPYGLYSISQMAHDAIDLLDHLGWTRDIHVIGISMGAMIALELVLEKPQYTKSLCLTSTTSGMTIPPLSCITTVPRLLFIQDPMKKANILSNLLFPPEWLKAPAPNDSSCKTNEERTSENIYRRLRRIPPQPFHGAIGHITACLLHYVSSSRLQQIRNTIPQILIATGTVDNMIKPYNSYYLAKQLGVDVECFEGAGHVLCEEQPERYNAMLENHLKKTGLV